MLKHSSYFLWKLEQLNPVNLSTSKAGVVNKGKLGNDGFELKQLFVKILVSTKLLPGTIVCIKYYELSVFLC